MVAYKVYFSEEAKFMRVNNLSRMDAIQFLCFDKDGSVLIYCNEGKTEAVEYELRKAERNYYYCKWEKTY